MSESENKTKTGTLLERLHDPAQLRVAVTALMLATGYLAIYWPFSAQIGDLSRQLKAEKRHIELARDVAALQLEVDSFQDRLPEKTDTNEWVQYVLGGVRLLPLKLISLDPESTPNVGPYQAVVLKIELEGGFHDLNSFLNWLASNQRLFRVNNLKLAPARDEVSVLSMQLTVMGVMGAK